MRSKKVTSKKHTPKSKKKNISKKKGIVLPSVEIKHKEKSSRIYFGKEAEDAIIQYNNTEDYSLRQIIYEDKIHKPFQKLVENVFNTFKFSYFETSAQDVQKECLSHLVSNLHKFDPDKMSKLNPDKKTKAYAYFSIVAKNFFILLNNNNYKKFNQSVEIGEGHEEHTVQLQHSDKYHGDQESADFMKLVIEFWENNAVKIFNKNKDINIVNAVVELFRNSHRIDAYNKKTLYLYIREMTTCKTQQITKVINRMREYHENIHRAYLNDGYFNTTLK